MLHNAKINSRVPLATDIHLSQKGIDDSSRFEKVPRLIEQSGAVPIETINHHIYLLTRFTQIYS